MQYTHKKIESELMLFHSETLHVPTETGMCVSPQKECWVCNGSGTKNDESCSHCDGNGKER